MTTHDLGAGNVEATGAEHEIATSLEPLITVVRELDVDEVVAAGAATQKRSA